MTTFSIVNGMVGPPLTSPASVLPPVPGRKAKKVELVDWIEGVTGVPLDGAAATVPELRARVDELVDALERGDGVGSVPLGDDGVADGEELGDGEVSPVDAGDEDAQAFGHED